LEWISQNREAFFVIFGLIQIISIFKIGQHFMKNIIKFIFSILIPLNVFAQAENINSAKYHPAKEVFEKKHEVRAYRKYLKSQILIYKNKVLFNDLKYFEFNEQSSETTKLILTSGLLNPYEINGSQNLTISEITELPLLNPNAQTKRFSFWIYQAKTGNPLTNTVNPVEYYFELQNDNANKQTSFKEFVEGSKLTFLTFGTIII
jgi:hypothetical protein